MTLYCLGVQYLGHEQLRGNSLYYQIKISDVLFEALIHRFS